MADNIVAGLFGLSPNQIQQQQQEQTYQRAQNFAQQSPFERANSMMYQGGAGLANIGAESMGLVNPEVEAARQRQAAMQGADVQTPEGLRALASRLQGMGMQQQAMMVAAKANEIDAQRQDMAYKKALEEKALRETEPKGEYQEIGVKGKPDYRQRVKMNPDGSYVSIGEPYQIAAGVNVDARPSGVVTPPKNLTREARLLWELKNGLIDQTTYDASIAATPGAKLKTEKVSSANLAESGFKAVERNINALYDDKTKSLTDAAKPLFGKYAQYRPDVLQSQETVDANTALESLTNQVMMANLADAKERVGQSFGSMQVQEWDKFTQQLTSLKRGLSEKSAAEAMQYVNDFIKTKRNILKIALEQTPKVDIEQTEPSVAIKTMPSPSQHTGRTIKDTKTGNRYKSDGTKWVKQ